MYYAAFPVLSHEMASYATDSDPECCEWLLLTRVNLKLQKCSVCRASSCDKHQFRAKTMVSTQTVFEISLLSISGLVIPPFCIFRLPECTICE